MPAGGDLDDTRAARRRILQRDDLDLVLCRDQDSPI